MFANRLVMAVHLLAVPGPAENGLRPHAQVLAVASCRPGA
jgi:hypothetical protein